MDRTIGVALLVLVACGRIGFEPAGVPTDGSAATSPSCSDGIRDQDETDVDCGGATCPRCGTGEQCNGTTDCAQGTCTANVCTVSYCGTTGCTAWNPSQLGGLALWFDPTDSTTIHADAACSMPAVDGSGVGCWNDKSGNGRDATQAATAGQPHYVALGIHGLPSVTWSAAGHVLAGTGTTVFENAFSIFVVSGVPQNTTRWNPFVCVTNGQPSGGAAVGYAPDLHIDLMQTQQTDTEGNLIITGNSMSAWISTAGSGMGGNQTITATPYLNGVAVPDLVVTSYSTLQWTGFQLGMPTGGIDQLLGSVGEIVITDTALTTAERQQVECYLACRWGID